MLKILFEGQIAPLIEPVAFITRPQVARLPK